MGDTTQFLLEDLNTVNEVNFDTSDAETDSNSENRESTIIEPPSDKLNSSFSQEPQPIIGKTLDEIQKTVEELRPKQGGSSHYFKVKSVTHYDIEIINSETNELCYVSRHLTRAEHGTFQKWPSDHVPKLNKSYPWAFKYPESTEMSSPTKQRIERNLFSNNTSIQSEHPTIMNLPGSPTQQTLPHFDLPESPTLHGAPTPVPLEILEELTLCQPIAHRAFVYAKLNDGWCYPAYIVSPNPTIQDTKFKVKFQDDGSEKTIPKNFILRVQFFPKEVPVYYENKEGAHLKANIEDYCMLDNGEPGYILRELENPDTLLKIERKNVCSPWNKIAAEIKQMYQMPSAPLTPSRTVDLDNVLGSSRRRKTPNSRDDPSEVVIMSPLTPAKTRRSSRRKTPTNVKSSSSIKRKSDASDKKLNKRMSFAKENTLPAVPE